MMNDQDIHLLADAWEGDPVALGALADRLEEAGRAVVGRQVRERGLGGFKSVFVARSFPEKPG
jgi:hypothetical protein